MKKLLTLVAALTLVLTIAGCKDDDPVGSTDADLVTEATTALLLTDLNEVTDALTLPTSGLHSSVITWSSSNTDVLADDGSVVRPAVGEDNAVITLTATITIGDESDTKEFTVRVIAAVPTSEVTIAVFNSSAVASDDDIVVTGVIFGIVEGAGFQISDGTGFVFVYAGSSEGVAIGDTVEVTGQKTIYYGLPEVDSVTSTVVLSSGDTLPAYEATSIIDLFDEDPFDTIYWSKPITITGMVSLDGGDVVITETDGTGTAFNIVVYYKSFPAQITAITALEGQLATVDVIVYGYHDGLGAWRVTIAENATLTAVVATDAEVLAAEVSQLDLGDLTEVLDDITLSTDGENDRASISWASDNEAVISTTGVVSRVIGSDTTVVLTATITVGDESTTKVFTATVKDADYAVATISVAEAIASQAKVSESGSEPTATPDPIVVKGIVTAIIGTDKLVIQDAAGGPGIIVFNWGFNSDNAHQLGDEIIIRGIHEVYFGLQELSNATLVQIISSSNTLQLSTTITAADIVADFATAPYALQGLNAVLTNLVVVDLDYDEKAGYIVVDDGAGNEIMFYADDISYSDTFEVGDVITELTVVIFDVYYSKERVIIMEYPELTEAQQLDAAAAVLSIPASTAGNITLPLVDANYAGLTIVWASSDEAVISTTGVVTQPLEGEADETVTLTATLSLGTATDKVVTFDVVVEAVVAVVPDIFFSEYIEGSSNNKAIEIYNPTASAILLDGYVINIYNNGATDPVGTLDLTGTTLAAGDVYVICSDTYAGPAICDVIQSYGAADSVVFFNGNDALELTKNGVAIDVMGVVGVDENWTVGSAAMSEYTLVRIASVTAPNAVFTPAEWVSYASDTFTYLGSHTVD